jgi:hypothetical protein
MNLRTWWAMQAGDILFVRTRGIIGAVVRWASKSEVNHVAMAVDSERILEIQPDLGIRVIDNPYQEYLLGRLRRPLTLTERRVLVGTAMGMVGRKYDWSLLGALIFRLMGWRSPWFRDLPCRYLCTEGVDVAYLSIGISLTDWHDTPGSLEGLLKSPWLSFSRVITIEGQEGEDIGAGTYR